MPGQVLCHQYVPGPQKSLAPIGSLKLDLARQVYHVLVTVSDVKIYKGLGSVAVQQDLTIANPGDQSCQLVRSQVLKVGLAVIAGKDSNDLHIPHLLCPSANYGKIMAASTLDAHNLFELTYAVDVLLGTA
jgi:hypothetical protein